MENKIAKRNARIHLLASIIPPLALLVSVSYTMLYHSVGVAVRWLTPLSALVFFFVGYFIMCLEERIFGYPRTDFDIDDGVSEETRRYVYKRFLILPALIAAIPGGFAVPLVDAEINRLVSIGVIEYYSEDFTAPWQVFGIIVVAAVLGASARMKPGNVALSPFSFMFHAVCHAALFIINIFVEVPSVLPTLLFTALIVMAPFELNAAFVENICRKTGDFSGLDRLRETNFAYVKRIARNFFFVYLVPFLLMASATVAWFYILLPRLEASL